MSRAKYPFKESDITRAYRAARKVGIEVEIEINTDRKTMRIIPIRPAQSSGSDLDQWIAKHASEAEGH